MLSLPGDRPPPAAHVVTRALIAICISVVCIALAPPVAAAAPGYVYCDPTGAVTVAGNATLAPADGDAGAETCTWVVGAPGKRASITLTGVDCDPGLSWVGAPFRPLILQRQGSAFIIILPQLNSMPRSQARPAAKLAVVFICGLIRSHPA